MGGAMAGVARLVAAGGALRPTVLQAYEIDPGKILLGAADGHDVEALVLRPETNKNSGWAAADGHYAEAVLVLRGRKQRESGCARRR